MFTTYTQSYIHRSIITYITISLDDIGMYVEKTVGVAETKKSKDLSRSSRGLEVSSFKKLHSARPLKKLT